MKGKKRFCNTLVSSGESCLLGTEFTKAVKFSGNWKFSNRQNSKIRFQQDGCPAHYNIIVKYYLNKSFPHRLIPTRTSDLSSRDFFLRGYLKSEN